MLPRANAISIQPVSPVQAPVPTEAIGDARQEAFQRSLQILLGKPVQGEVLSRLTDGSFLVKVAGTSARMMLPPGAQVGTEVAMTLVAVSPRPTFQIAAEGTPGAQPALVYSEASPALLPGQNREAAAALRPNSLAATLLGKAPLTPANLLPELDPGAPPPSLSNAARVIHTVLTMAQSASNPPQAIIGTTALMASASVRPEQLAQTLHEAVGHSGLFYESHVAEWAEGKRTLPELMREPQMLKAMPGGDTVARALPDGTDLAMAQLINLQLHTHEQARVQWQGELWPGQPMEWEINKDAPEGSGEGEAAQPAWRSGVRFQFPLLGAVSASLVLIGGQVHIHMQTASTESAAALRAHAAALEQSLDAAGAPLSSLTISQQAAAGDAE